ncbi:MAG: hypothetical protein JWO67_2799 [Streptosporangiaceae bacterium]|nr:hypothetical protein [Streptosporangiaceae bacterium]
MDALVLTRDEVIRRVRLAAGETGERDCVLCPPLRFRFNDMAGLPGADGILCGDPDFYVVPDLAPVVEGHLLLVSMAHWTCAGAFPGRLWRAALRWRDDLGEIYREAYGTAGIVVLEHGPASPQGAGSCIDHAHWHLLPGAPGVRSVVESQGLTGVPATHQALGDLHAAGRSYLLVEEDADARVYAAEDVPGQFLRWAAATAAGPGEAAAGGQGEDSRLWRWQEMFGLPASRHRFLTTLRTLLPVAGERGQRPCDSHQ